MVELNERERVTDVNNSPRDDAFLIRFFFFKEINDFLRTKDN